MPDIFLSYSREDQATARRYAQAFEREGFGATSERMAIPVTRGNPPTFGTPRRIHPGPLAYASAHSVDIDPRGDRLIISPGYAVQGDLTVLVNWQAAKAQ